MRAYAYDAGYIRMTVSAACALSEASVVWPHSTGKERDTESGNDYMFARYYNSATGRFLSPDWSAKVEPVPYAKLDNPQSLNLYNYVLNNPVGSFDPDGHACKGELCQKFANFLTHNGWKTDKQAFPAPAPRQWPTQGPPSMQGVNPATGQTLFSRDPKGVTGNERPGAGGSGNFGSCRGSGCSRTHQGEDISAPVGSAVHASTSGTVTFSGSMSGYGNAVRINNGAGVTTLYGHDSSNSVAVGDHVTQGQVIGLSGQTGNAAGQPASEAHIHFEVSVGGTRVDPAVWLDSAVNPK
jgi:RHS repeat-associated protein